MGDPQQTAYAAYPQSIQTGWAPTVGGGSAPVVGYGAPQAFPAPGGAPMPGGYGYPTSPGHHQGAPMLPPGGGYGYPAMPAGYPAGAPMVQPGGYAYPASPGHHEAAPMLPVGGGYGHPGMPPANPGLPPMPNSPGFVDPHDGAPAKDQDAELALVQEFSAFSEQAVRRVFIRKVFGILSLQLLITLAIMALCMFEESMYRIARESPEMLIAACVVNIVLVLILACCGKLRRKTPWNFILLFLFTITEGFMLGVVSAFSEVDDVLIAVSICAVVCFSLVIFAMQTKWDFTVCGGALFVCLIVFILFGILAAIFPGYVVNLVYSSLGALLFSIYLIFDVQMMMGGKHKYSTSPEEYIFAALSLYLDVINLFLQILKIVAAAKKN